MSPGIKQRRAKPLIDQKWRQLPGAAKREGGAEDRSRDQGENELSTFFLYQHLPPPASPPSNRTTSSTPRTPHLPGWYSSRSKSLKHLCCRLLPCPDQLGLCPSVCEDRLSL
ncbi:hypothetical protein DPEC_G00305830 [Dallia pectoralis]|uniref:Uncharacterized protein n=1 Tax=Dallia pectoralis TaxID=75939 RepID=A0ACC2FDX9_DALPE|nr:hypothetical protein DPEC_G00305830 [Dallia pectoralis]